MGCHRKASRNRLKHLVVPAAAIPALAGMAAAVCLAPQAQADPAPAHAAQAAAATRTGTMSDALSQAGLSPAELFAAVRQTSGNTARPARYTVRSGDSLSGIAGKVYHKQNAWTVLYWANRGTIHWANMISEGQVLKVPALPAKIPAAPGQLGPAAAFLSAGGYHPFSAPCGILLDEGLPKVTGDLTVTAQPVSWHSRPCSSIARRNGNKSFMNAGDRSAISSTRPT